LLGVTFLRRLPFQVRAGAMVFLLMALMFNSLFSSGLRGDARLFSLILIMVSLAFFGTRGGWTALGLTTGIMVIMAWAVVTQRITLALPFDQLDITAWEQNIVVSVLLGVVAILVLQILMQEFTAAQRREREALERVIAESEQLEKRVTARTKDLAAVAEVGTATATLLETGRLLQEVVDLTKQRFNLYHSHIYLLDQSGENLVLASGAGEAGRQMVAKKHSIPLSREQSLVARAARERKGVTVNDVRQASDFLPNPLLPDTRSELAVPMIAGGNVIGVFDIQSEEVGRFTESDINIQTTLSAQVAISIQNAQSYQQSKTQAELETLVNTIGQKIQRTTTVEDTLQTAIRELGLAIGASRVKASIQAAHPDIPEKKNSGEVEYA
jgi:putative methionine-R-sulfoxide reductase with GAF domain